ncbi:MAG TPA: hypothetical protein VMW31_06260 [Devosiaceae bacterium]|nr:hypothetical protein [Devosiaceae bacterium]
MHKTKLVIAAAICSAAMATGAAAADLFGSTSAGAPLYGQPGFDWDGFYFGVQKGWWVGNSEFAFDAVAGANFMVTDNVLVGIEGMAGLTTDFSSSAFEAFVRGRVGLLMAEDVLIYKVGEVGSVAGSGTWGLGGGIEFAATDHLSARGEARGVGALGGGLTDLVVSFGVLWHPN